MKTLCNACFLLSSLIFCGSSVQAQEEKLAITDPAGATYSITGRYNNRNDYLRITKVDARGDLLWEADYDIGVDEKPIDVALNSTGVVILVTRPLNNSRSFSLINYSARNYLIWDRLSDTRESDPVSVKVDKDDNIYVCGNTKISNRYRAGLWKFDSNGTAFWHVEYAAGENAYARQLQILFNEDLSLGVTVFTGSDNYGQYERRAITYDSSGRQMR